MQFLIELAPRIRSNFLFHVSYLYCGKNRCITGRRLDMGIPLFQIDQTRGWALCWGPASIGETPVWDDHQEHKLEEVYDIMLNCLKKRPLRAEIYVRTAVLPVTRDGTIGRSNSTHAPTTEFSSVLCTRSEASSYCCAYSGQDKGSRGSHTQACCACSVLCA